MDIQYYLYIHRNECALGKLRKFYVLKAFELQYCLHDLLALVMFAHACNSCRDRDTTVNRDAVRRNMLFMLQNIARSKSGMFLFNLELIIFPVQLSC